MTMLWLPPYLIQSSRVHTVAYPELVSGGFPKVENLSGW